MGIFLSRSKRTERVRQELTRKRCEKTRAIALLRSRAQKLDREVQKFVDREDSDSAKSAIRLKRGVRTDIAHLTDELNELDKLARFIQASQHTASVETIVARYTKVVANSDGLGSADRRSVARANWVTMTKEGKANASAAACREVALDDLTESWTASGASGEPERDAVDQEYRRAVVRRRANVDLLRRSHLGYPADQASLRKSVSQIAKTTLQ